ncbi:MAG: aminotransferase class I/II-fold pyridoxal phosphate-dependent enzyme [Bacteroidota bacterium]
MLEKDSLEILKNSLVQLENGFSELPEFESSVDIERLGKVLDQVALRMQDNFPYFHPFYAGQMLKPPHPIARLGYMLAMWINPNNHALDGGKASSEMEKEVVADLAKMFGWDQHIGHLCGGGTMANMEALWVSRHIHPQKAIAASQLSHYTHSRISEVLGISYFSISCTPEGILDIDQLEELLQREQIGTVVATMGTTGTGSVDPLPELLELQTQYGFRIHADCAYGGYFYLASNLSSGTREKFDGLHQVDSIVIDPHKHGLQPYGCGCVLFRDPKVGAYYKHDSPYTYFSSEELHLGEISLECSRAGAAAVGLWATHQYMPLEANGEFGKLLTDCRGAALRLLALIETHAEFLMLNSVELDILCFAKRKSTTSEISHESQRIFQEAAKQGVHLALLNHPTDKLPPSWNEIQIDSEYVTCLRSVLMKPEHKQWTDQIWNIIISI